MPAGDAWNLRWGETSRFAVGSTRRFRSLARPSTQRNIDTRSGDTKGVVVEDRCFEAVFVWLNQWYSDMFLYGFSHMNHIWRYFGTFYDHDQEPYFDAYLFLCFDFLWWFDMYTCISSYMQCMQTVPSWSYHWCLFWCLCQCQLSSSSGLVSSPQIGTLTQNPTSWWWVGLLQNSILETDSMNCVEVHHFVIKQNM